MENEITERHIRILEHSLGDNTHYRNHYCTGPESTDWDDLEWLEAHGYMTKRKYHFDEVGNSFIFHVTNKGKALCFKEAE